MVSEIQGYFANFDDQWLLAGIGSRGYFQVAGLIMAAPLARVREMERNGALEPIPEVSATAQ